MASHANIDHMRTGLEIVEEQFREVMHRNGVQDVEQVVRDLMRSFSEGDVPVSVVQTGQLTRQLDAFEQNLRDLESAEKDREIEQSKNQELEQENARFQKIIDQYKVEIQNLRNALIDSRK